jgi:MYXO-CTERM domain-containing protein
MSTTRTVLIRSLAAAFLTLAASAQAVTYDLTSDLRANPSANPNGVWSFGWSPANTTGAYTFQAFDVSTMNGDTIGWNASQLNTLGTPGFWYNGLGYTAYGVEDGQLSLHPGPDGSGNFATDNAAIVRFTVPVTGLYSIRLSLGDGDTGLTEGWLVLNGDFDHPMLATSILEGHVGPIYSANMLPLMFQQGDTLDLVVGNSQDDLWADNTPISFSMVSSAAAVPEPEQWALALSGLGVLGALARRRT